MYMEGHSPPTDKTLRLFTAAQQKPHSNIMEYNMSTVIKWTAAVLLAGLAWLVAGYTDEYFRPYKKIRMNTQKK